MGVGPVRSTATQSTRIGLARALDALLRASEEYDGEILAATMEALGPEDAELRGILVDAVPEELAA
jgi:hypothetical protein